MTTTTLWIIAALAAIVAYLIAQVVAFYVRYIFRREIKNFMDRLTGAKFVIQRRDKRGKFSR